MDCVQIFSKNQRQWNVKPLADQDVKLWFDTQKETGITDVVTHDSYLINLASPKKETLDKSIKLFHEELVRCETLGIPTLVTHPGAHMKEGEDAGRGADGGRVRRTVARFGTNRLQKGPRGRKARQGIHRHHAHAH